MCAAVNARRRVGLDLARLEAHARDVVAPATGVQAAKSATGLYQMCGLGSRSHELGAPTLAMAGKSQEPTRQTTQM